MAENQTRSDRRAPSDPYRAAESASRGRRRDEVPRERRAGASALATWSGRRLALTWLAWFAILIAIITAGAVMSVLTNHGTTELRLDLTRANFVGLLAVAMIPPACLTFQWWRMRGRRR